MEVPIIETRNRSPNFCQEEEKELLILVYENLILPGVQGMPDKQEAFERIAKLFNQKNMGYTRTAECLRKKWHNMRNVIRKKNGLNDINEAMHTIYMKLSQQHNKKKTTNTFCDKLTQYYNKKKLQHFFVDDEQVSPTFTSGPDTMEEESSSSVVDNLWSVETQIDGETDDEGENSIVKPSVENVKNNVMTLSGVVKRKYIPNRKHSRFTQAEIALLLQCAKKETKDIFNTSQNFVAVERKQQAWARITKEFNKSSPTKRDAVTLSKKFMNMKYMMAHGFRSLNNKNYKSLDEEDNVDNRNETLKESEVVLKVEPEYENRSEKSIDNSDCIEIVDHDYFAQDFTIDFQDDEPVLKLPKKDKPQESREDPLGNLQVVATRESQDLANGAGSSPQHLLQQVESPEIVKLKLELLKYQMETAKMERKRIENLVHVDEEAQRSRSLESSLRLRAARLEAIAAASRLNPDHPALQFTQDEAEAQRYLEQFSVNDGK